MCCRSTARILPWSGTASSGTWTSRHSSSSSSCTWPPSTWGSPAFRATGCACTCAGATTTARTSTTSPWPRILPELYRANVGALSIEFANPRHQHEYEALRANPLPPHMLLIPGVLDTTTNFVEHPQVVARRLQEAVAAVGDRERVIAGTDCGFGTFAGREYVAEEVVWLKLAAAAEGARIASDALWGRRWADPLRGSFQGSFRPHMQPSPSTGGAVRLPGISIRHLKVAAFEPFRHSARHNRQRGHGGPGSDGR